MKVLASLAAAAALLVAPAAFADGDAAGVGIGAGGFNASATSSGALNGPVMVHTGSVNFAQTTGTSTSAGVGLGVATATETTQGFDGVFGVGATPQIETSTASIQAFGNASAATTIAQQGSGIGLVNGSALSSGSANAFGGFAGIGFAAASNDN